MLCVLIRNIRNNIFIFRFGWHGSCHDKQRLYQNASQYIELRNDLVIHCYGIYDDDGDRDLYDFLASLLIQI